MSTQVASAAGRRPRRWPRLADARIGAKLAVLLVIPLVVAAALAGGRLAGLADRATDAGVVRDLTVLSATAAEVAYQLHHERVAALGPDTDRAPARFNARAARVDNAAGAYARARDRLTDPPAQVEEHLRAIDAHLADLATLRAQVLDPTAVTGEALYLRYGAIIADIQAAMEATTTVIDDPDLSQQARAAVAMSQAARHAADAEAIGHLIATSPAAGDDRAGAFLATQAGQREALLVFARAATPGQQTVADKIITGGSVEAAAEGADALAQPAPARPEAATTALAGMVDLTRHTEARLYQQLQTTATLAREAAATRAVAESVAVVVALLVAIALAVLLARTMTRALSRLETAAISVAGRELPATVAHLSDPANLGEHTPSQLSDQVRDPVPMVGRDQIGQVAAAFNTVHRAAVRVAAEQAALRTSVQTMFLNLARRSQALVDRMITRLDQIERDEADSERLAQLFDLDVLATRMRRNDENLLILAGADSSPARTDDHPLPDVLRAAQSEIEHYTRVEFGAVDADVQVAAVAVNDVVRLAAELLDNATRFSPPQTQVLCEARRLGDQVIIQVEDHGVGQRPDQLADTNRRLASPPAVGYTSFRRMGLEVVSKLAARHHIRVEFHPRQPHGTLVYAVLPPAILTLPPARALAFTQRPQHQPAPPPMPSRHVGNPPTPWFTAAAHPQPAPAHTPRTGAHPSPRHSEAAPTPPTGVPLAAVRSDLGRRPPAAGHQPATAGTAWPPDPLPALTPHPAANRPQPREDAITAADSDWHTAADYGWSAAATAASPTPEGATLSGLPRRTPQAQLVPGGVHQPTPAPTTRPSPDQVRGMLTAYQRGVQRGRGQPPAEQETRP